MSALVDVAKRVADRLPAGAQERLKRVWYAYRASRGSLDTHEPEWARLGDWIRPGDTVLDIGANIGVYTLKMSELVGPNGRVIAFEPVPQTFRLLAGNVAKCQNVTLINAAVSAATATVRMSVPMHRGWLHPSRASISEEGMSVLAVAVDGMNVLPVSLIKIDVEGHEFEALSGMRALLARDRPVLIVEGTDPRVVQLLSSLGYLSSTFQKSPNTVYAV